MPYIQQIDRAQWYSNFGKQVSELEARLARLFELSPKQTAILANGTLALTAALQSLNLPQGAYCAVPSFTFTASVAAIRLAGLNPFFVDVSRETWSLEPASLSDQLRYGTKRVVAAMPVSPFGSPLDIGKWLDFASSQQLRVLIDAAWCFDSIVPSTLPAMVSLHATKVLGIGEGAFLMSEDERFIARVKQVANYGINGPRGSVAPGGNYKMSEYAAAVGHASLDDWNSRRDGARRAKAWYLEAFSGLRGVEFLPKFSENWTPAACPVIFEKPIAADVLQDLKSAGIESRMWWGNLCHRQPAYREFPAADLPVTEWLQPRVLCLPFFDEMSAADVLRVRDNLVKALAAL